MTSAAQLFNWLYLKLSEKVRLGQRCQFPAINRTHTDEETSDNEETDDSQLLKKRLQEMQQSQTQLNMTVKTLLEENDRLLRSSKSWYAKYQELAENQDKLMTTPLDTPFKKTKPNFEVLYDDVFYESLLSCPSASWSDCSLTTEASGQLAFFQEVVLLACLATALVAW